MIMQGDFITILFTSGTILSVVCSLVILLAWCFIPQWRTLQNYISLNQILYGTLHIFFFNFRPLYYLYFDPYLDLILSDNFMRIMIVWSLSSSLLAYLRLVFVYNGKISHGKVIATTFVFYVTFVMTAIDQWLVRALLTLNFFVEALILLTMYLVVMINLFTFIRIVLSVMSCCKKSASRRNLSHVLSLVGVAVICDSAILAQIIVMTAFSSSKPMSCVSLFLYTHRLVFQTIFVLFRKSSMTHFSQFFRKLRNRRFNNMPLV